MAVKYQVFVSSTYEDLKVERDMVIKAILEMGHIPVGMEMFSAADEEQWRVIARNIDESDYYCVIVAHRYGSTSGGISFTRKEYEYAVSKGVPVLGFVIDESVPWPPEKSETTAAKIRQMNEFKDLVKSRTVSFWKSTDDLYGRVSIALSKAFASTPRDGWTRASSLVGPEVTRELTRLSIENSDLRAKLDRVLADKTQEKSQALSDLAEDLSKLTYTFSYKYSSSEMEWSKADPVTYLEFFDMLAPSLAIETELDEAAKHLCMLIREDRERPWWIVANNQVRDVLAELMARGLVAPSSRKHGVTDKGEYWTMTALGRELHADLVRRYHQAAVSAPDEQSGTATTDEPSAAATDPAAPEELAEPKRKVPKASA